jgi:hypothetical protein
MASAMSTPSPTTYNIDCIWSFKKPSLPLLNLNSYLYKTGAGGVSMSGGAILVYTVRKVSISGAASENKRCRQASEISGAGGQDNKRGRQTSEYKWCRRASE